MWCRDRICSRKIEYLHVSFRVTKADQSRIRLKTSSPTLILAIDLIVGKVASDKSGIVGCFSSELALLVAQYRVTRSKGTKSRHYFTA